MINKTIHLGVTMFIYKITVNDDLQYIGLDSHPSYKNIRWNCHKREYNNATTKHLYNIMKKYGLDNCVYEILEEGFDSMFDLAIAEMRYIKKYDTFKNGLNSTYGGDGMQVILHTMSDEEISLLKLTYSKNTAHYNNTVKWADTTLKERQEKTKHLHTKEIYEKKSKTLKLYYERHPEAKIKKSETRKKYIDENKEKTSIQSRINGRKNGKRLRMINPEGKEIFYETKNDFKREYGTMLHTIIKKTLKGQSYKGWKGWVI